MKVILSAILVWLLCVAVALVSLVWMPVAAAFGSRRARRIAVAYDQLGNATGGGDEDEVFSARCWRCRDRMPYSWLQPAIDKAFELLAGETDHCRKAWEAEQR